MTNIYDCVLSNMKLVSSYRLRRFTLLYNRLGQTRSYGVLMINWFWIEMGVFVNKKSYLKKHEILSWSCGATEKYLRLFVICSKVIENETKRYKWSCALDQAKWVLSYII